VLAATLNAHQIGQFENYEVMSQCRGAKAGRIGQFPRRTLTAAQYPKNSSAMGIR